jgi:hypothetical protein
MRALWLLAVSSTIVGCLDDNKPAPQPTADPPKAELPKARAPETKPQVAQAPKIDLSLGEGYEMRRPINDGRLTIIPIITTHAAPMQKFVTLHDGMRKGIVSVREVGGSDDWEVDTVRVTNQSNEPLVILEGELIEDAMQDRITAENVVIDPHKTQRISVRCVEEDRDHGGTTFHAGNAIAELSLRRTLVHRDQEAVWSKVKQINAREKLYPSTNTYRHLPPRRARADQGRRWRAPRSDHQATPGARGAAEHRRLRCRDRRPGCRDGPLRDPRSVPPARRRAARILYPDHQRQRARGSPDRARSGSRAVVVDDGLADERGEDGHQVALTVALPQRVASFHSHFVDGKSARTETEALFGLGSFA